MPQTLLPWTQVRRQDSVTAGAAINFGEAWEVYLCESERGTGAREIHSSVDQTNKVKTKKKGLQFKNFHKFWSSSQNLCNFPRILKWRTKKKQKKKEKQGFRPKSLRSPVWVHENYENTGGEHQFGSLKPRFALQ